MSASKKEQLKKIEKVRFSLGQIRIQAEEARKEIDELESLLDPSFAKWKCDGCGHEKHFTKASTIIACGSCPKCKGTEFSPVVQ